MRVDSNAGLDKIEHSGEGDHVVEFSNVGAAEVFLSVVTYLDPTAAASEFENRVTPMPATPATPVRLDYVNFPGEQKWTVPIPSVCFDEETIKSEPLAHLGYRCGKGNRHTIALHAEFQQALPGKPVINETFRIEVECLAKDLVTASGPTS